MIAEEANVLLTKAALLDPRMKRVDPVEQADMATAWAEVLADVALTDALSALEQHYRQSRDAIMPADVLTLLRVDVSSVSVIPDRTAEVLAASRRAQLEAVGLSEEEAERMPREILAARLTAVPAIDPLVDEWPEVIDDE